MPLAPKVYAVDRSSCTTGAEVLGVTGVLTFASVLLERSEGSTAKAPTELEEFSRLNGTQ